MSSTKTIQVNKDFFSLSGKSSKRREKRKKPERPKTLANPTKLRKEFMKRVQAFQDKKRRDEQRNTRSGGGDKAAAVDPELESFNKDFDRTVDFMQELAARRAKHRQTQKANKEARRAQRQVEVSVDTPTEWSPMPGKDREDKPARVEDGSKRPNVIETPAVKVTLGPEPPYSTLRGGTKPTYRDWIRQTQKRPQEYKPKLEISGLPHKAKTTERAERLKAFKDSRAGGKEKPVGRRMIRTKRTTRTVKRKLGKSGRSVGVLIKSRETRKRIQTDRIKLSQTSILEIKRYLRDRNLIKAGSRAPNDVLRKMYEQCVLTGDVSNKSADVLIHNYMNEDN